MQTLGRLIKTLIINEGISQKDFAIRVGLSETALSNIITGKVRPRQATLTRMIQSLNLSDAQEQELIKTFESHNSLPEEKIEKGDPISIYQENRERVNRYMEIKARTISFQAEVEHSLSICGIDYKKYYIESGLACDFFLPKYRIALECKFNVMRDPERTITSAKILRDKMNLNEVIIVVPMKSEIPQDLLIDFERMKIRVLSMSEFVHECSLLKRHHKM